MFFSKCITMVVSLSFIVLAQSPFPKPGCMDSVTVYGFSQVGCRSAADKQISNLHPDINIRTWSKWQNEGIKFTDFSQNAINTYKNNGILLIGGLTATVYFYSEAADSEEFRDMVSRDIDNELVLHSEISPNAYRGNLANPRFRQYIINLSKIQIDAGVDGIFFDEANAGLSGNKYDGNEGFDDYHLKDFNKYLAEKYPDFTYTQWHETFDMDSSNFINKEKPLDDLENNFNYRKYIKTHGLTNSLFSSQNPLSGEWGTSTQNRPQITRSTFIEKYTTDVYWKEIVAAVRDYARTKYGKEIMITSNGIFPYVDFNSVGLYNYNADNNGNEAQYVPVKSTGRLNGALSLKNVFKGLYYRNAAISGNVPCVLFIDWPTTMMNNYYQFTVSEKMDYWRIYAAEAYAHGLFFAFHLRTAMPNDPTAVDLEIFDSLVDYAKFYKDNRSLFIRSKLTDTVIETSANRITTSLTFQPEKNRYLIHLINHNYDNGIKPQFNVSVTIPGSINVKKVRRFSPDKNSVTDLQMQISVDKIICTVDTLNFYTVLSLEPDAAPVKKYKVVQTNITKTNNSHMVTDLQGKQLPLNFYKHNSCNTVSSGIYIQGTTQKGQKSKTILIR